MTPSGCVCVDRTLLACHRYQESSRQRRQASLLLSRVRLALCRAKGKPHLPMLESQIR